MRHRKLPELAIPGLHEAIVQSIPLSSYDIPVLDIGCGTGAWLERLANLGFTHLHGIDLDIQKFGTDKATCSQANLNDGDWGLGSQKFGLITAIEVIEHLENPGRFFCKIARHLDKNGYLLLTTPNIHSINCRLKFLITGNLASFDSKGDPTHIYPVLINSLQRILPRYSLEIVKQWGYPDQKSLIFRPSTQFVSNLLKTFLPNELPYDTLCLMIRHN